MVANALITADSNPAALAELCLRGCWIPLPLKPLEAFSLFNLVVLTPGCRAIEAMGAIHSFRCSDPGDGELLWTAANGHAVWEALPRADLGP